MVMEKSTKRVREPLPSRVNDDMDDIDNDEEVEMDFDVNDKHDDTDTIMATTTAATTVTATIHRPSSSKVTPTKKSISNVSNSTSTSSSTNQNSIAHFSPELLSQYYSRLFPFTLLTQWLSYNPNVNVNVNNSSKLFTHREFSFTIEPSPGEEIYMRYKSFANQKELQKAVLKRQPRKIDIGAIFTLPPKDQKSTTSNSNSSTTTSSSSFKPNQRELVFDIDLTDYDMVRKCGCSNAKICKICWKLMNVAVQVMDQGLKEDFGFEHIAWFYSGRRGVHCWVCDEGARVLSDAGRSAVANYFEVNLGSDKNQNVEIHAPLHPMLQRAYTTLEPMFIRDILSPSPMGQNLIGQPSCSSDDVNADDDDDGSWGKDLLATLPPTASSVASELTKKWNAQGEYTTPKEKWNELKRYLQVLIGKNGKSSSSSSSIKQAKKMSNADKTKIELWPIKTVFSYCYPRLDINVSKMQNHLLKSPFCVHPKTGRVCVPIDVTRLEDFDPFAVPTLNQLMDELDKFELEQEGHYENEEGDDDVNDKNKNKNSTKKKKKLVQFEWEKTSLKEPFRYFQNEFLHPMLKELKKKEKVKNEKIAAARVEF
mmetsp:Transcript_9464/g.11971  ORF Transcript_9464/g.11971 Transcript_9464/m.11971 type:complete len:594 (-) Transcript_9464:1816-3597(-)